MDRSKASKREFELRVLSMRYDSLMLSFLFLRYWRTLRAVSTRLPPRESKWRMAVTLARADRPLILLCYFAMYPYFLYAFYYAKYP